MRDDLPSGTPVGSAPPPSPLSAPLAYSPQQQEHQALLALHKAINGELSGLRDFRRFQGVGADAVDNLKRHFEIKSFSRAMPPTVELTTNEFKRALQQGAKYYLAVVAGLEEGYDTVVRIIADPANTLQPQAATTVVLGGIENVKSADRSAVWLGGFRAIASERRLLASASLQCARAAAWLS